MTKRPAITPAMRLNVLKKFGAVVLCQICGDAEYVAVVQIDHERSLVDGGEHCADTNLRPVCIPCHARKSAREHKNNAKAKRLATKHSQPNQPGTIKSRGFQGSRKFDGTPVWRTK
jgi:5-methylcytosine-specific restriction endonuclease McrA